MKKTALVFLFVSVGIFGVAQCNCTVLFPLSNQYEIMDSDTVGEYATVTIGEADSMFAKSILVNFIDTFKRIYSPVKVPFKVVNHSNWGLIFKRENRGTDFIAKKYSKETALKGDTLSAGFVTRPKAHWFQGLLTKEITVLTNQCRWIVRFRGIVKHDPRKED